VPASTSWVRRRRPRGDAEGIGGRRVHEAAGASQPCAERGGIPIARPDQCDRIGRSRDEGTGGRAVVDSVAALRRLGGIRPIATGDHF
jgi:hypothetical protein